MWIFNYIFSNVPTGYPRCQIFFNNEIKSSLKKKKKEKKKVFIIELQETAEDEELRKLKSDFTFARCAATPLPLCDSGTSVEISSTC